MDTQLQEIRDALEPPLDKDGNPTAEPDHDKARTLASAYVPVHPELYTDEPYVRLLADGDPTVLVKSVDTFRAAGMVDQQWQVEAFLLHHVAPQSIGGVYRAHIQNTGQGG